jgi:hypothetical protein
VVGGVTLNVNVAGLDGFAGPQAHIDLPTPAPVIPGNTYILRAFSRDAANNLGWCSGPDTYSNGRAIVSGTPSAGTDLGFRTYVALTRS